MAYTAKFRKQFIEKFRKNLGILTLTCKQMGINPHTYYGWMEKYPKFKEEIEYIKNAEAGDFVESKFFQKINEGDTTAIIFALKTRFADRGYQQALEVNSRVKVTDERTIEEINAEIKRLQALDED